MGIDTASRHWVAPKAVQLESRKNLLKNEKNSFGFDYNAAILYCDKKRAAVL